MSLINQKQIRIIHSLLGANNLMEYKMDFIVEYSKGRVQSCKELTYQEAESLIEHLNKIDPSDRMRKKVISICYRIGMIYGDTPDDKKMNQAKVYSFVEKIGYLKKPLNSYKVAELGKLLYQFEQILKSSQKRAEKQILQSSEVEMEIKKLLYESFNN